VQQSLTANNALGGPLCTGQVQGRVLFQTPLALQALCQPVELGCVFRRAAVGRNPRCRHRCSCWREAVGNGARPGVACHEAHAAGDEFAAGGGVFDLGPAWAVAVGGAAGAGGAVLKGALGAHCFGGGEGGQEEGKAGGARGVVRLSTM
jgi:hypothetical protein